MATLLGGINRGAVAPEMMEYGDKLDQQLNDPNAYYKMPDENVLLHTNRAFDMADRGQIARSEVPTIGYLNSNMKDTQTREKALGMDLMNRKRFANKQNAVQPMSPEEFTKAMGDTIQGQKTSAQAMANMDAGLESGQISTTQAGTLGGQPVTQPQTEFNPTLQGVTPEMMNAMAQNNQIGGVSTLGNNMMYNPNVSLGRGGRELGQSDIGSNPMEAMAYAKALGWNAKDYSSTEKRVNPKTGDVEERTVSQEPYLQEGYDENMNISTPRVGLERVESPWRVTKKFVPKAKKTSNKNPMMEVFKKVSKPTTLKDNVVDEMSRNQKFINYTSGKSEATKESVKEYSKLAYHKLALENLDDEEKDDYLLEHDLGDISYSDIVNNLENLNNNLRASGLDINNELGANMYNDSYDSAMKKYASFKPIGSTESMDIIFKGGDRIDIQKNNVKRTLPVGSNKAGKEFVKLSLLNRDTGAIEVQIYPVDKITEPIKKQWLKEFVKSGNQYYGSFGTSTAKSDSITETKPVSYLGSNKEKMAYDKAMVKKDEFEKKLRSVKNMDEAWTLNYAYQDEVKNELSAFPEMASAFAFASTPIDANKDGKPDDKTKEQNALLFGNLDKKFATQKGYVEKQKKAIKDVIGKTQELEVGELNGNTNKMKYRLTPTKDGIKVSIVSSKGITKDLPEMVALNFISREDINTRAGEIVLSHMRKRDSELENAKVINTKTVKYLK